MISMNQNTMKKCTEYDILNYLTDRGWSDLIDSKWTNTVIEDIKKGFPNASDGLINKVLNIVIW